MGNIHNYASNIKYDNTKTDFISETVQDVLDEIASHNHSTTEQMSQDINKLSEEIEDLKENGGGGNVDLTGYATEEFVENAIIENAFYKPIPIESIEPNSTGTLVYYNINIENLDKDINYYFNPKEVADYPNARIHMGRVRLLCDDGSYASITTISPSTKTTYLEKPYDTKWYLSSDNYEIEIDFTDRSTSSAVITKRNYNAKYLLTGGNAEYIPDTDYSPATKKYVDDLIAEKVDKKDVPTKTSQLTNDSGFLIEKPKYTASEVGADASGTAQTKVSEHNVSEESHSDIRLLIEGLTTRLNTLANSDDTTLDQMAEVVAYIKNNKSLIDGITTNKVNVSDIIDNLTTSVSNKPLSAKQGVQLKALIDAIVVPTKTSQLQYDSNFVPKSVTDRLTEEIGDHSKNTIVHVTNTEKETWNNKSNFSGSYNDLSDKPTIPTVPTSLKNPYKLTISLGDSSYTYDGSKAVSITIEDGSEVIY